MATPVSHGRHDGHDSAQIKPVHPHPHGDDHKHEHVGLEALGQLFCPWRYKGSKYDSKKGGKTGKKITFWQVVNLVRRIAIFAAAIIYITRSINATVASVHVLRATSSPLMEMGHFGSSFIKTWVGSTTIRESPLIMQALDGSTALRNTTLYLESTTTTSFTGCTKVPYFNPAVYNNTFLRTISATLIAQAAYNLTFLAALDVIAPVVDCSFDGLTIGAGTIMRTHYLVRHKNFTDQVSLMTFSFSMQDYSIPKQNQKGPAGVATMQLLSDLQAPVKHYYIVAQSYPYSTLKFQVYTMIGLTTDHEWRLLSIPSNALLETPKELVTSSRSGMYINVETEQSNIKNAHPVMDDSWDLVLSRWHWQGGPVLRDSWGWVHCIHAVFAIEALLNLVVLFMVIYRNLVLGKIWVGDAFVSVSNTLLYRGALIILTWVFNDGWTLMEFCFHNANAVTGTQAFYSQPDIIKADLLTLFLSLASIVGFIFRERIDPALAVFAFEIGFGCRVAIGRAFPATKAVLARFALSDLIMGTLQMSTIVAQTTPMRLWTTHELATKSFQFIFSSLLPTFSLLGVIIVYAICRKIYRHYFPEKLHILKVSDYSEKTDELQGMKRTLTMFEIATGAALQRRVGVVSDYENCLFIKGMKYASADGIYCNGYVIANGKFLIATADLVVIFIMKILRLRFKNVYVYEVDGSTVQQTARLLYPQTIAWHDLLRLNISVLS